MEQLKVLAAALALREFTVDEISGLSGVNPRTVRSVLRRHPSLICRVEGPSLREGAVSAQPSRGRPSNRWMVADGDQVRRLIDEAGALPRFEPNRSSIGDNDRREAAVAVAEDALAQVGSESDEALQGRLIRSARSSLFFGDGDTSSGDEAPWWQTDDSQFAVRARGVNALAALQSISLRQSRPHLSGAKKFISGHSLIYSHAQGNLLRCSPSARGIRSLFFHSQATGQRLFQPTSIPR
jgi:hypothetical protein